mgnify:FL=1
MLKVGFDADITILDDSEESIITEAIIEHKHKKTPYLEKKLKGKVKHVFVNGIQVLKDAQIIEEGKGELLLRS